MCISVIILEAIISSFYNAAARKLIEANKLVGIEPTSRMHIALKEKSAPGLS